MTPDDYIQHAMSRFRKEDYPGAEAYCSQAIQAGLNTADVYYLRGKTRHFAGDVSGAIADYTRAIELDATHALAYERRGEAYRTTGNDAGGQQDTLSAIQAYPIYHQRVLAPPDGYLPVSHRIPAECWSLRHLCLDSYETRAFASKKYGNLADELENWQAFLSIGGTIDYDTREIEARIRQIRIELNAHGE